MVLSNLVMINYNSDIMIFLFHIVIAFVLSFLVGFERQWRRRSIGLRMAVLVCLGSLMFTHASLSILSGDIGRIASQIVSGIGFLGAGIIIQDDKKNITGLNTASTIWCSAAIGMLCAQGLIIEATIGTVFILLCNIILRSVALTISRIEPTKSGYHKYSIKVACKSENMASVRNELVNFSETEHIYVENIDVVEKKGMECTVIMNVRVPVKKLDFIEHLMNTTTLNESIISLGFKKMDDDKDGD
ncbi:MAG: MgtC/SapB family protein [Bacilli bacterium]|nr:MgtC/SapB family protein [Bacilli bacterium]